MWKWHKYSESNSRINTFKLLFILTIVNAVSISTMLAQDNCQDKLELAQEKYNIGLFNESLTLLKPCPPDSFLEKDQKIRGYRLMALAYIAADYPDSARQSVKKLLKVDPGYSSNRKDDPDAFKKIVTGLKPNLYEQSVRWIWKGKKLANWAGRALIVGVGVYFLTKSGPQKPEPIPGPPPFPE